jgi:uncharacterized protein
MLGRMIGLFAFLVFLLAAPAAMAQAPAPDALSAANKLLETMHYKEQVSAILPGIFKALKPSIVQNRAEVDRQYDNLTPVMIEGFQARLSELSEAAALVYSRNFSREDLLALTAFYKTPAGQRLLQKLPTVTQELLVAGSKFGQSVAEDMRKKMIEELKKKGVDL